MEVICVTVYEMAKHYFNRTPRLWDKSRLKALVQAGRLTVEEYKEITGEYPEVEV